MNASLIRHHSVQDMNITDLNKRREHLALGNHRQEERARREETKAATLTIGYVISQGAILISISNRSALQCDDWFVPFSLSLLLGIVYFITFWEAINMWYRLKLELDLNYLDLEIIVHQIHHLHSPPGQDRPPEPDAVQLLRRKSFIALLILALIAFQGVMLYACRSFLCHGL